MNDGRGRMFRACKLSLGKIGTAEAVALVVRIVDGRGQAGRRPGPVLSRFHDVASRREGIVTMPPAQETMQSRAEQADRRVDSQPDDGEGATIRPVHGRVLIHRLRGP